MGETRKKILIIEDEMKIRSLLKEILEIDDYTVSEASNGVEGEKKILLESPDLIILDLNLPERRGEDILKFIKEHSPTRKIPVVILTGEGTIMKKVSSYLKGAVSFINKPFENEDILNTVRKHL